MRPLSGIITDLILILLLFCCFLVITSPKDRFFDIRGANVNGAFATYYKQISNNLSVKISVKAAMRQGGYLNITGKVIYATSSYLMVFDPAKNTTFLLGQDFSNPLVQGIPSRITFRVSRDDGFRRVLIEIPSTTSLDEALSTAESYCSLVKEGDKACYISGVIGIWYKSGSPLVSNVLQDLLRQDMPGGLFSLVTAGREIVIRADMVPLEGLIRAVKDLRSLMNAQGMEVMGEYHSNLTSIIVGKKPYVSDLRTQVKTLPVVVQERC